MAKSLSPWIEKIVDKIIHSLQDDVLKRKIQILILQPFLQYFLELIFPYVVLVCVVFGLMIILMISILGVLVFRTTTSTSVIG